MEELGLAEMELRLRQKIIGTGESGFASNECDLSNSGLGWKSDAALGAGECSFGNELLRFGISFNRRWRSWWAVIDSREDLGKNKAALLKRSRRSL